MPAIAVAGQVAITNGILSVTTPSGEYLSTYTYSKLLRSQNILAGSGANSIFLDIDTWAQSVGFYISPGSPVNYASIEGATTDAIFVTSDSRLVYGAQASVGGGVEVGVTIYFTYYGTSDATIHIWESAAPVQNVILPTEVGQEEVYTTQGQQINTKPSRKVPFTSSGQVGLTDAVWAQLMGPLLLSYDVIKLTASFRADNAATSTQDITSELSIRGATSGTRVLISIKNWCAKALAIDGGSTTFQDDVISSLPVNFASALPSDSQYYIDAYQNTLAVLATGTAWLGN